VAIALVVLYHVGGVYEGAGMWASFWIVDDPDTISWVGIVSIIFDVMVMPIVFFVSGYLTPHSLEEKTGWEFAKGKFMRLMIPWAIAVVTLIPLYKMIFLYSRGLPQEGWTTYFHITNPNSMNWLWFLPLLFYFNLIYLLLTKLNISFERLSLKWAVVGVSLLSLASHVLIGEWLGFRSWTLTPVIDFENERVLMYLMIFLLGVLCFQQNVFARKLQKKTLYNIVNYTSWLPITGHIFARLWPFFVPGFDYNAPFYRFLWWLSFDLSLLSIMYLMIVSFWLYLDRTSKVWKELNKNSYGVYIIHVIVIGIFGTLLLGFNLPAVVKWLLLIVLVYGSSNLLISGYRLLKQSIFPSKV
jgi:hypothetical protein